MGQTSFDGPVYGAWGLLAIAHMDSVGDAIELLELDVPATTDWYVTHVQAHCSADGNADVTINVKDDGTSIFTSATPITLVANDSVAGSITADPNETGKLVAASSNVTVVSANGTTTPAADVTVHVYGYARRKVATTASF